MAMRGRDRAGYNHHQRAKLDAGDGVEVDIGEPEYQAGKAEECGDLDGGKRRLAGDLAASAPDREHGGIDAAIAEEGREILAQQRTKRPGDEADRQQPEGKSKGKQLAPVPVRGPQDEQCRRKTDENCRR
jgi:hypothetical protein